MKILNIFIALSLYSNVLLTAQNDKYSRKKDYSKIYPAEDIPLHVDKLKWTLIRGFQYKDQKGFVPSYRYNPVTEKLTLFGLLETDKKVKVLYVKRLKKKVYYGIKFEDEGVYITYRSRLKKKVKESVIWVSGYNLKVEGKF